MCKFFQYTSSAYYKSLQEAEKDCFTEQMIIDLVLGERRLQPRLGGKKLYFMLRESIHKINPHFGRDEFFRLLREHDLLVERRRQYRKTTNSWHHFHKYGNIINGLAIVRCHQVWTSAITYLRIENGFVYLSLLTDMYSRKIVGWSLSESLSIEGSVSALKKAIRENVVKKLIHHSDRGVQYCSHEYVKILKKNKIEISMTEESHCYENALAERVNGILKDEYLLDRTFRNFSHAEKACKEAINLYNTRRPHGSLQFQTPEQVHNAV